jgi:hypothetical protein
LILSDICTIMNTCSTAGSRGRRGTARAAGRGAGRTHHPGPDPSQVLALWRDLETRRNRFAVLDHAVIGEVQSRHLHSACGARTVTVLARQILRVGVSEASARVKAAEALGRRRSFTGELLAPIYGRVAAAQANGSVAEAAARVITGLIDTLPDAVRCEKDVAVEEFLVKQASILDLDGLRQVARRLELTLDPDGTLKDAKHRDRQRDLRFTVRPWGSPACGGGSSRGGLEFTAELTMGVPPLAGEVPRLLRRDGQAQAGS